MIRRRLARYVLALAAATLAPYATGCQTLGNVLGVEQSIEVPDGPRARFIAAVAGFEAVARVAYEYGRNATPEERRVLASVGDAAGLVIQQTRTAVAAGTVTDAQLEAAATFIEGAVLQLRREP